MDLVEAKAKELGCRTITLNTMPSSYVKNAEWWASQGVTFIPAANAAPEDWYIRRGYRECECICKAIDVLTQLFHSQARAQIPLQNVGRQGVLVGVY